MKNTSELIYNEYLFKPVNCEILIPSCVTLAKEIEFRYKDYMNTWNNDYMQFAEGSNSTKLYETYNVFLCHLPGFSEVFELIIDKFKEKQPRYKEYAVAGWVNIYHKGGYLDWHKHGSDPINHDGRWHGYVCVNAEPSKTLYADDNNQLIKEIVNKNGYITLSPAGLMHRVTPWEDDISPRITIAFDFIKRQEIDPSLLNRWIPVL